MTQTANRGTGARKRGSSATSSGTGRKRTTTRSAGTGKSRSGSGRKTASGRTSGTGSRSAAGKNARRTAALEKARRAREQRAREIRMDITVVVVLVIVLLLYFSLLGFCGSVGAVLGQILFGLFGIGSWGVPAWTAVLCVLLFSEKGGRSWQVRMFAAAVILLVIEAGGQLFLHAGNVISLEAPFDPAAVFRLCAQRQAGGGILGGGFAWGLYRLFGMAGSILVCAAFCLIALILIIQRSPAGALLRWRQTRREAGIPGLSERRAMYRQRRLEELEEEEEARLEREADRILEREDRAKARADRLPSDPSSSRTGRRDSLDLEHTRLDGARRGRASSTGTASGAGHRKRHSDGSRTGSRDVHEILLLPPEDTEPLTLA